MKRCNLENIVRSFHLHLKEKTCFSMRKNLFEFYLYHVKGLVHVLFHVQRQNIKSALRNMSIAHSRLFSFIQKRNKKSYI